MVRRRQSVHKNFMVRRLIVFSLEMLCGVRNCELHNESVFLWFVVRSYIVIVPPVC